MTDFNSAYEILKFLLLKDVDEKIDSFFREWTPDKGYTIGLKLDIDRYMLDQALDLELDNASSVVSDEERDGNSAAP